MTTLSFTAAEPVTEEFDTVPPANDVEYPCAVCGREAGPYTGRGRKPTRCADHKKSNTPGSTPRMSAKSSDLAAQAAKTLASMNGMIALAFGGLGFMNTMSAVFDRNEDFEKAAYGALVTDPNLCRQIVRVGQTSAKLSLGFAYLSLGMGIAPIAAEEYKVKKEARRVQMEEQQ